VNRLAADEIRVRPARFAPDALIVEEGYPLRISAFDEGAFVVQDEASQIVAWLASQHLGGRVLDTCASPGGKTTAIAAAMDGRGLLVACDVRARRVELLRKTIAATGAPNVRVVQADLLVSLPFSQPFDTVLVDVPCSGLGTLRRDPDIRWRRREGDLHSFAAAELTMVKHAADAVAPGGRLIYATCSSEPEENEAVVDAFLAGADTSTRFAPVDVRMFAPAIPPALADQRGHLRTAPDRHELEAFFAAVFERRYL
jgi:16S rRNA (cytosine967-C5)-methyltransferase